MPTLRRHRGIGVCRVEEAEGEWRAEADIFNTDK